MAIQTIDLALRGGVVMLLLLVATLLVRDHGKAVAAWLGACFALGVAAYAICSAPGFASQAAWWHVPLIALASGNAIVFWLFASALFSDDFRLRWWQAAAWLGLVALAVRNCFVLVPTAEFTAAGTVGLLLKAATLVFAALALVQSLWSWRADLVEGRRRLRLVIVGATAVHIIVSTTAQVVARHDPISAATSAANAFALAATTLIIVLCLVRVQSTGLFGTATVLPPADTTAVAERQSAGKIADAADRKLLGMLERMMCEEKVYREENLTIGDLAVRLAQPEYKLRRLINQGLGYRNFNAFLNGYRICDAKAALSDPKRADLSILTIAMQAGFQSLGPFNRAFKADTGMTPTEFRRSNPVQVVPKPADSRIG